MKKWKRDKKDTNQIWNKRDTDKRDKWDKRNRKKEQKRLGLKRRKGQEKRDRRDEDIYNSTSLMIHYNQVCVLANDFIAYMF